MISLLLVIVINAVGSCRFTKLRSYTACLRFSTVRITVLGIWL